MKIGDKVKVLQDSWDPNSPFVGKVGIIIAVGEYKGDISLLQKKSFTVEFENMDRLPFPEYDLERK